jgi:hypothetical protein
MENGDKYRDITMTMDKHRTDTQLFPSKSQVVSDNDARGKEQRIGCRDEGQEYEDEGNNEEERERERNGRVKLWSDDLISFSLSSSLTFSSGRKRQPKAHHHEK